MGAICNDEFHQSNNDALPDDDPPLDVYEGEYLEDDDEDEDEEFEDEDIIDIIENDDYTIEEE